MNRARVSNNPLIPAKAGTQLKPAGRRGWIWIPAFAGMSGALGLALAGPVLAGQPVSLKTETFATGAVTLGDLFDGAGRAGAVVVGPAAAPGANIVLDAGQVQRSARAAGLDWDNATGLRRIVVHGEPATAQPTASVQRAGAMKEVLTYGRNLNAGDIVRAEDLTWGEIAAFSAPSDTPDPEKIIGKAAKKPLRAGAPVATRDVTMPQVIKRDDIVQVSFRSGGVSLTLQGKAMEAATLGEPFSVLNSASKKVIEAVAVGPGRAVVGPEAERVREQITPSLLSLR